MTSYQRMIPGVGMRWCTKYLFFRQLSEDTDWYGLKKFVDQVEGAETVLTTVLMTKDTRPGAGKKKMRSRCEAIVELESAQIAEKVLMELQGMILDGEPANIDFSSRPARSQ